MRKHLVPIAALLLGSGFLFCAGGITGLILPVRGSAEGFSSLWLGLLGTGWAVGFIAGCLMVPGLVQRVGHVRSFSVMAALAGLSVLLSSMLIDPIAWVILRAVAGFAFAGAAMIVESWLTDRSAPQTRGIIFGTYTMVNLCASTAGQVSLAIGDTSGFDYFVIAAMFYAVALIPTAISSSTAPQPLQQARLDIGKLWRNSPIAVVAVVLAGLSNGSFGTLAAVYGELIDLDVATITLFVSAPLLAGALAQIPVGYLSDRMDRRAVLAALTIVAIIADGVFILARPQSTTLAITMAAVFGAAIFTFYPVIVAHANDHASPGEGLQTSGGLLLLLGVGSIIGPLVAGAMMTRIGPDGLFYSTLFSHVVLLAYTGWRMTRRGSVDAAAKVSFVVAPQGRSNTPQTIVLASPDEPESPA